MSKNTEDYKRSLYLSTAVLSSRQECVVEKVVNSFDGSVYVRRRYREDKTEIYRMLAELKSPYLPEIIEIFENDGQTEIIESYIEGKTLARIIADGEVNKRFAKKVARQLLSAVADIQKISIIHRDIKPENIVMSGDKLTLIDFGIARIFREEETRDTRHLGTEGYAAPEQYGFSQSDKRTDIFSAGKTILKVCEAAHLNGVVKHTAERCAQFDPLRRFETAEVALQYLRMRQKILPYAIACIVTFAFAATAINFFYVPNVDKTMHVRTVTTGKTEPVVTDSSQSNTNSVKDKLQLQATDKQDIKHSEKTKTKIKDAESKYEIAKKEEKQKSDGQSRIGEDSPPPANYREYSDIIFGKGKVLWLFYPGDNAKTEDTTSICGNDLKIVARLKNEVLCMKLGRQDIDIAFGEFVGHKRSETTMVEADIFLKDIDGDGTEEIFIGLRQRHGFATDCTMLWFARYADAKFVLCDSPLCFKDEYTQFNIEVGNRITTKFYGDIFHIDGYKFVKDKPY